jgi:hypothetical protein
VDLYESFSLNAALAQRFGERFKDKLGAYLAGNWEHFIIHGLRWMVQPARKFMHRPAYRAPTWSWASLDGVYIREPSTREKVLAQDQRCVVRLGTDLDYGMVDSGFIDLRGPMIPVMMATERSERLGISYGYDLCVMNDQETQGDQGECIGVGCLDPGKWPENGYHCLGLVEREAGDEPPTGNTKRYDGILLLQIPGAEDNFIRAGWFFGFANFLNHSTEQGLIIQ